MKLLSMGCKKFNMDPKKGIEFLVQNSLLEYTENEVAQFLYKGEGLSKTAIGDYLGEKNEFNETVLRRFLHLHDFTDLILVQVRFLKSFFVRRGFCGNFCGFIVAKILWFCMLKRKN